MIFGILLLVYIFEFRGQYLVEFRETYQNTLNRCRDRDSAGQRGPADRSFGEDHGDHGHGMEPGTLTGYGSPASWWGSGPFNLCTKGKQALVIRSLVVVPQLDFSDFLQICIFLVLVYVCDFSTILPSTVFIGGSAVSFKTDMCVLLANSN